MEIMSFSSFGYEGEIVKVEADLRRGLPIIDIVGLPGSAVKEARERMRAAIRNSNLIFPQERVLINLSPANLKKEGSGFDLPIALSVLNAGISGGGKVMAIGELELSGKIRPIRGVLAAVSAGVTENIFYYIVPKENEAEALITKNIEVFAAENLQEAVTALELILQKSSIQAPIRSSNFSEEKTLEIKWNGSAEMPEESFPGGFEDIIGQDTLIKALEIAAAGGHNLIAYGPPGCGKTLSLRRFPLLLPDIDIETALEVTRIYSVAGLLPLSADKDILITRPPFRMPHPNASLEGIIGGAGNCMPGEISFAHGGVLFLDEASQFKQSVLETLRAPLETGMVTVSRAGRSSTYPADFQLLLAINPCPCGNFGTETKVCTCMLSAVEKYWKKLTAPLLDRIDLRIEVQSPDTKKLISKSTHSTKDLRLKVAAAIERQWQRHRNKRIAAKYKNAYLLPEEITKVCILSAEAKRALDAAAEKESLSGRGSHALLKIARTIADLEGEEKIASVHIEEAYTLRKWSPILPDFL
ncbi:YifB family Mg chelatase-like AAA ATPase [Treponema phagedenis]|uniref:YifB family Mg chelatase-like AAA ATPase n=1 Tax=Treponema phagedenis TaxID=162 RepID=UPI0011E7F915|nr:YifB family Mg chelatase-like AAA ATPase [Treponema phagedenis]QEJ95090.1 YifB family Mg chelatase-like AAA ATPase [Treponema phagedenis]